MLVPRNGANPQTTKLMSFIPYSKLYKKKKKTKKNLQNYRSYVTFFPATPSVHYMYPKMVPLKIYNLYCRKTKPLLGYNNGKSRLWFLEGGNEKKSQIRKKISAS